MRQYRRMTTLANRAAVSLPMRERIYFAAVNLIFERGYDGTSTRAIAKSCGLQMSSLYHHFPSKQAILVEIMTRTMKDLTREVSRAVAAKETPEQRLPAAAMAHIMFHTDRIKEAYITDADMRSLRGADRRRIIRLRDGYQAVIEDILGDGAARGVFSISNRKIAVYALISMLTQVAAWYKPEGRLRLEDIADEYTELYLHGVMPRRKPHRRDKANTGVIQLGRNRA